MQLRVAELLSNLCPGKQHILGKGAASWYLRFCFCMNNELRKHFCINTLTILSLSGLRSNVHSATMQYLGTM